MKLVNIATMHAIEQEANQNGLTFEMMMENAGRELGRWVDHHLANRREKAVTGLIGPGNNGGDTLIALEYLAKHGWKVFAYLARPRSTDDPLPGRLTAVGGAIFTGADDAGGEKLTICLAQSGIVLDGVLGTGFRLPLKPEIAALLSQVKQTLADEQDVYIVAVDCPSGVDCDSGEAAPEVIAANTTVCMAAVKEGLLRYPAFGLSGGLVVVNIGLPDDLSGYHSIHREVVDEEMVRNWLPQRPVDAHKGTFGTALMVAGSVNYTGAALLAGKAAYRSGAGLVMMAVVEPLYTALAGQFPECIWLLLPHENGVIASGASDLIRKNSSKATAMLLGSGWGLEEPTSKFLNRLLDIGATQGKGAWGFAPLSAAAASPAAPILPPLVVDADGLKLLVRIPNWYELLPKLTVLTPHPGEMSILCGLSKDDIQADREAVAMKFARQWGHVVVLKGAFTVVADPDGRLAIIPVATPALARAGTGDVLAGIITGLRAQGMSAFEAAAAGAWIHGQAGLLAAQNMGNTASVLAGDVVNAVAGVFSRLIPC